MPTMQKFLIFLTFLLLACGAFGQGVVPDPNANAATRLIAGCAVNVAVEGEDELSGDYAIDVTGELHFTLDDGYGKHAEKWTVVVRNKTADEARDAIAASLKVYLKMPVVKVVITRVPRLRIEVSGPVAKEGRFDLPLASRLSDLLKVCAARQNADLADIRILRRGQPNPATPDKPPHTRLIAIDYEKFLRGETDIDPILEQNDKILIAEREDATPKAPEYVRIGGEVGREVALPFAGTLTVSDAIARAGGLLPTADMEKSYLIRGLDGKTLVINVGEAMQGNPIHNLSLYARDTLIVGRRDQSLIYSVGGEVKTPLTLPWKDSEHPTLTGALAQAGGVTKNADRRKGLLRKNFLRDPNKSRLIVSIWTPSQRKSSPTGRSKRATTFSCRRSRIAPRSFSSWPRCSFTFCRFRKMGVWGVRFWVLSSGEAAKRVFCVLTACLNLTLTLLFLKERELELFKRRSYNTGGRQANGSYRLCAANRSGRVCSRSRDYGRCGDYFAACRCRIVGERTETLEWRGVLRVAEPVRFHPLCMTSPFRPRCQSLVCPILGEGAFPVRGIFFDKTPEANWKVGWHQDLTIAVRERRDAAGFGAWSEKAGVVHVQPPPEWLARLLTVRLHLDDCPPENGALRVLPGSHQAGRLRDSEIAEWRERGAETVCAVPRGGALVLRPLLLHASSASEHPVRRRVLHIEYAAENLPDGLQWRYAVPERT